jgi:protein phosphatase
VEQFWEEILPIFDGKVDVATASQRLVEIGNTQNGHDNVTVGLVYCQVKFSEPEATLNPSLVAPLSKVLDPVAASVGPANATSLFNTQLLPSQPARVSRFLPILLGLVLLVSLGSGLINFLAKSKRGTIPSPVDAQLSRSSVSPTEPQGFSAVPSLGKGVLIRTKSEIVSNRTRLRPDEAIIQPQQRVSWGIIPVGSVLQVVDKQLISAQDYWLNLKVCSTPNTPRAGGTKLQPNKNEIVPKNGNVKSHTSASKSNLITTNLRMLQPKDKVWIRETEIEGYYLTVASLEPAWRINCPTLTEIKVGNKE